MPHESFWNVKICRFLLFYIIVHAESLGFGLLVGQNKIWEDVALVSGNL